MLLRRFLAVPITGVVLGGCALSPDYIRPDVTMPDRYLNQDAVDQRAATITSDHHPWWQGFKDPVLTDFVVRALSQNLTLAQASARVVQARAGLLAANAALLPSGGASGQATRAHVSIETPMGQVLDTVVPDFDRRVDVYEANLEASWELDLFGGLRRGKQASLAEYQASEAAAAATQLAVAAQTADIYISIRGLQQRLSVTRRQVSTQEQLLEKVRLLQAKGLAAELQVSSAEGALSLARASVPALEASLDAAMNALDVMLGSPPGTYRHELTEDTGIPPAPRIADTGSPRDLLRRRPDLIEAERHLAAANARIGVAMAEYYPKLSLGGLIGSATALSSSNLFTDAASQSVAVLGLRWRLFDFGRINAQINLAKGREAEALAAYRESVLRATQDVEDAFSALVSSELQARLLAQGVESLERARNMSFAAYEKGAVSLIEVLHADETLLHASDAQVQAQTASARAAVAAFKALGGHWDAASTETISLLR